MKHVPRAQTMCLGPGDGAVDADAAADEGAVDAAAAADLGIVRREIT